MLLCPYFCERVDCRISWSNQQDCDGSSTTLQTWWWYTGTELCWENLSHWKGKAYIVLCYSLSSLLLPYLVPILRNFYFLWKRLHFWMWKLEWSGYVSHRKRNTTSQPGLRTSFLVDVTFTRLSLFSQYHRDSNAVTNGSFVEPTLFREFVLLLSILIFNLSINIFVFACVLSEFFVGDVSLPFFLFKTLRCLLTKQRTNFLPKFRCFFSFPANILATFINTGIGNGLYWRDCLMQTSTSASSSYGEKMWWREFLLLVSPALETADLMEDILTPYLAARYG